MNNQLTPRNSLRFSLTSCATEDSVDSAGVATPLDVSPCPQRNVNFPILNPAEESPYLTRFQIPDVAAVVGHHRHRVQDTIPRSIRIIQTQDLSPPPSQPSVTTQLEQSCRTKVEQQGRLLQQSEHQISGIGSEEQQQDGHGRFNWPRIKRILSSSSLSSTPPIDHATDSHRYHTKKKSTSSRGVMTHLSSLVHNSMRLSNSIATIDQQQQDIPSITSSKQKPSLSSSSSLSAQRWFGKNKSRVGPHHRSGP